MAATARLAGVSPLELAEYPPDLFAAVYRDANESSWGVLEELVAGQTELLGLIYRLLAKVLGGQTIDVLRIPRPVRGGRRPTTLGEVADRPGAIRLSPADAARRMIQEGAGRRGDSSR